MNNSGTDINQLLDQKNKLTSEESSIVDSIVNDLNSKGVEKTSQEKLPQITDEEKEMLMRQRMQQEQQNRHKQAAYQQKMMQQQQMQEQIHKQQLQQQQEMMDFMDKNKDESMVARKSFAARHKCAQQKDRTSAAYWACNLPRYAKSLGLSGGGNFYW